MKLVSALGGLAALCGVGLATAPASAMPMTIPGQANQTSNIEQASYACNEWGHCWHRHYDSDGYYHPHYRHHWHPYYNGGWGYGGGWHRWHYRHYGDWGYGGWHHWHPHYYGGWGGGWPRGHHWNQW
jgi:hypothetical protein